MGALMIRCKGTIPGDYRPWLASGLACKSFTVKL
jgi:hypothetical protein